jgi:hypothetical protein
MMKIIIYLYRNIELMKKSNIISDASNLVKKIREYSRSQKELWQQVPWLALEADGRTGWGYSRCYNDGLLELDACKSDGRYQALVDLATGDIINAFKFYNKVPPKIVLADDEEVLRLSFHMDQLDVKKFVGVLKREAKKHYGSYYDPQEQEARKTEIRERSNLQKIYVR